jgi:hypothetical protein
LPMINSIVHHHLLKIFDTTEQAEFNFNTDIGTKYTYMC